MKAYQSNIIYTAMSDEPWTIGVVQRALDLKGLEFEPQPG